jgi:hypothetical protein
MSRTDYKRGLTNYLRAHDVLLACKLFSLAEAEKSWTYSFLAAELEISGGEAHNSADRCRESGLLLPSREISRENLRDLLSVVVPRVFIASRDGIGRGMPTSIYAAPLAAHFRIAKNALPLVWPAAESHGLGSHGLGSHGLESHGLESQGLKGHAESHNDRVGVAGLSPAKPERGRAWRGWAQSAQEEGQGVQVRSPRRGEPSQGSHHNDSRRGDSLLPICPSVPAVARRDVVVYELLALADVFRVGSPVDRERAGELLALRLLGQRPAA